LEGGGNTLDGINSVYEDCTDGKSKKNKYGFMDGVRSFTRPSAVKKLIKDYGTLRPRTKLKKSDEIDE
jgi:hypothetical protein